MDDELERMLLDRTPDLASVLADLDLTEDDLDLGFDHFDARRSWLLKDAIWVPEAEPIGYYRDRAPEGYRLHAVHELDEDHWRVCPPHSERRCSYVVGPQHMTCRRPAVALLNRWHWRREGPQRWYGFCDEPGHMYAWWMGSDGRIWHWVLEDATAPPTRETA
jgi:hypothetical protein